jgi:hypothetical protein
MKLLRWAPTFRYSSMWVCTGGLRMLAEDCSALFADRAFALKHLQFRLL